LFAETHVTTAIVPENGHHHHRRRKESRGKNDIYTTLHNHESMYADVFPPVDEELYSGIVSAREEWEEYDDIYCSRDTNIEMYLDILPGDSIDEDSATSTQVSSPHDVVYRRQAPLYANVSQEEESPETNWNEEKWKNLTYDCAKRNSPNAIARSAIKVYTALGKGNFGSVYKGEWRRVGNSELKEVAVKQLEKNTKEGKLKFLKEALTASQCQHCNVIEIYATIIEGDPVSARPQCTDSFRNIQYTH
jgi:hypothetical protein